MATQPMSSEAIALTEKKMDMTLDDLIKMSKRATTRAKKSRAPNKNQRVFSNPAKGKSSKLQAFMDSRASLREGALACKRSNFQGNHFPLATEVARKVAAAPFRGRASNRPRGANLNKSRSGTQVGQGTANGGVTAKPQTQQLTGENAVPTQRPKTLDSLFANLREQRVNALSRQNSNSVRRNSKSGSRRMPPWNRAQFAR